MKKEQLESFCLSLQGASKSFPFGDGVEVYKVMNKIFAIISIDTKPCRINLKALPEDCIAYREIYACVTPGYHMNKKHWNTIICDGSMKGEVLKEMVEDSYGLIVSKLTKKEKEQLTLLK
jgi:predicted DNA-binding protein (MmcQ/YjbR family)